MFGGYHRVVVVKPIRLDSINYRHKVENGEKERKKVGVIYLARVIELKHLIFILTFL